MWCHIIDFLSVPFGADKAPGAIVCLFIYPGLLLLVLLLLLFLFFLFFKNFSGFASSWSKAKNRYRERGEGDDKAWSETVTQRGTWYGRTHIQAISLITSDRKGAEGNSYSHGHFHCGAPLAMRPIYAFNTHTCTHTSASACIHTHIHKQDRKSTRLNSSHIL